MHTVAYSVSLTLASAPHCKPKSVKHNSKLVQLPVAMHCGSGDGDGSAALTGDGDGSAGLVGDGDGTHCPTDGAVGKLPLGTHSKLGGQGANEHTITPLQPSGRLENSLWAHVMGGGVTAAMACWQVL